jgi:hypothetical protein
VLQPDLSQTSPVYKSESLPPAQIFILCETSGDDNCFCEDGNEIMGSVCGGGGGEEEEEEEEDTTSTCWVFKKELVVFGVCLLVGWLVGWLVG